MSLFSHFGGIYWVYAPHPMAEIVVRPAEDRDQDALHTVWSLTYNNGDPFTKERRNRSRTGSRTFVTEVGGQIVAVCNVLDISASRGKAVLACGGVAAVAVLPELRRSGVGSAMMSWLVEHLKQTNTPLSSLYAFREPFYRKFGYEVTGRRLKIVCPTSRWPKLESHMPIRRLTPADWEELVDCYTEFAETRSGLNIRTASQWQRVLGENRQLTIYAVGMPVEAYAVVSHVTAFWTTDHISELAWSTRSGYEGILSMLGGLAINKTALSWFEPSDGPFYSSYLDQGVEVSLDRPIMFRVNDVQSALSHLKPDCSESGEFVIQVNDSLVSDNHGNWRVRFSDGQVEVQKTQSDWGLSIDIRHFAQAFLGEPSLAQLASVGKVGVNSPEAFSSANILMPGQSTYCMDFF